jgi:hypothetical protein
VRFCRPAALATLVFFCFSPSVVVQGTLSFNFNFSSGGNPIEGVQLHVQDGSGDGVGSAFFDGPGASS